MTETQVRNRRKVRQGVVVSRMGDKSISVEVSTRKRHPKYGKMMTSPTLAYRRLEPPRTLMHLHLRAPELSATLSIDSA